MSKAKPLPAPLSDEPDDAPGMPPFMRTQGAAELDQLLTDYRFGKADDTDLLRFVRGSIYLLDAFELESLGNYLARKLRDDARKLRGDA